MTSAPWWRDAVFYQVYPRSFADGNGDGIGDLAGLLARLDYLQDLGVDALWLSPHYPSPMVDCGYDVADYTAVAPEYGTLDDFQRVLDGAHARGLRVILDFVLNHTSDQHPWFRASRAGRASPQRDWFIWRDGRAAGPPNNWASAFGGSAWEFDPAGEQYYYHYFFKEQPDLNWRHPPVRAAMFDAARFWLERGVDGFRLDALGTLFEDPELRDHQARYTLAELHRAGRAARRATERERVWEQWRTLFARQVDRPEVHEVMRELRALVERHGDAVLVGETEDPSYHGSGDDELHMVFNFPLMHPRRLTAGHVRANQAARLAALPPGAWPCNTLGNHDSPRVASRYAGRRDDPAAIARLALALVLTLRGTPFLYNGEEIGMTDLLLGDLGQFRDTLALWRYRLEREELGASPAAALAAAARHGRDKCRTPLQWANAPNGGFCPPGVRPWLPVNPNYAQGVNVAEQDHDQASLLNFYRQLLRLRRATPALRRGDYRALAPRHRDVLLFERRAPEQTCVVALNFSARSHTLPAPAPLRLLYAGRGERALAPGELRLGPYEILIAEIAVQAP